jgi:hypothetical protein
MNIEFISPLERGWNRMTKALFKPFDMRKWFVVGFTAFLAGATSWGGRGGGKGGVHYDVHGWHELFGFPSEARHWLADHPSWAALIFTGVFLLAGLILLFTWLSSRGKFMFLDNVARGRDRVSAPWHEYRHQGNSLFVWRLILGLVGAVVIGGYLAYGYLYLRGLYNAGCSEQTLTLNAVTLGLGLLALFIIAGFIGIIIEDFIVAVMAKKRAATLPALRVFWDLFKKHPGEFVLYGIMVICLKAVVVAAVLFFGFATCCIGFLLLAIPYISSVVLLPVSYTMRAFSLEFLAQFGTGFNLFSSGGGSAGTVKKAASKKLTPVRKRKR